MATDISTQQFRAQLREFGTFLDRQKTPGLGQLPWDPRARVNAPAVPRHSEFNPIFTERYGWCVSLGSSRREI